MIHHELAYQDRDQKIRKQIHKTDLLIESMIRAKKEIDDKIQRLRQTKKKLIYKLGGRYP